MRRSRFARVIFIPCFFIIFLGAPVAEKLRENHHLTDELTAIGAAVAGVIVNRALWFGLNTMFTNVGYPDPDFVRLEHAGDQASANAERKR